MSDISDADINRLIDSTIRSFGAIANNPIKNIIDNDRSILDADPEESMYRLTEALKNKLRGDIKRSI